MTKRAARERRKAWAAYVKRTGMYAELQPYRSIFWAGFKAGRRSKKAERK